MPLIETPYVLRLIRLIRNHDRMLLVKNDPSLRIWACCDCQKRNPPGPNNPNPDHNNPDPEGNNPNIMRNTHCKRCAHGRCADCRASFSTWMDPRRMPGGEGVHGRVRPAEED
ncbi:MAG: hypothetical protein Q9195_009631 [Heterodermia aff. obscurata]